MGDQILDAFFPTRIYTAPPELGLRRPAPCPHCGKAITPDDDRTHSIAITVADDTHRSFFYSTHRSCDDMAPSNTALADFMAQVIRKTEPSCAPALSGILENEHG